MLSIRDITVPSDRTRDDFILFRRKTAIERALPPKCGQETLDIVYQSPLVCVEFSATHNRFLVSLYNRGLAQVLSRHALRFVPFPFDECKEWFDEFSEKQPLVESIEMGLSGIPQIMVYTPPLWVLLRTARFKDADIAKYDVVVPIHFLHHQYRLMLRVISDADFTSELEDCLDVERDGMASWVTEDDTDKAYDIYCKQQYDVRTEAIKEFRSNQQRLENESLSDDQRASLEEWIESNRFVTADDFLTRVPVPREAFDLHRERILKTRQKNISHFEEEIARKKKLEAKWQEAIDGLFSKYLRLTTLQRKTLRDNYAAEKEKEHPNIDAVLRDYGVDILNALEMQLMTIMSIPANLRLRMQTHKAAPLPEFIPQQLSAVCDRFSANVAACELEQRKTASDKGCFSVALPTEMLEECKTAADYNRMLVWMLDNWSD